MSTGTPGIALELKSGHKLIKYVLRLEGNFFFFFRGGGGTKQMTRLLGSAKQM